MVLVPRAYKHQSDLILFIMDNPRSQAAFTKGNTDD